MNKLIYVPNPLLRQKATKINSVGTYAHNTLINNTILDYIEYFTKKSDLIIYTDSKYLKDGISQQ